MELEFIDANASLPHQYSMAGRPSYLGLNEKGPDGRSYRFIGTYEKSYSLNEKCWLFVSTLAKTFFSLGIAIFSEKIRDDWKSIWKGKKIIAIYQSHLTPLVNQTLSSPVLSTTAPAIVKNNKVENPFLNIIQSLVKDYREDKPMTIEAYKNQFSKIMTQLGYENGGLDQEGNPVAEEFKPLFDKMVARLGVEGVTCKEAWPRDRTQDLANEHVAAFVYHDGGHFSTWICQKNEKGEELFYSCPEYLLLEEGFIRSNEELEPLNKQAFTTQYGQYSGYIIYSNQKNNSTIYPGKLPNINSCAFDSAIHVLAKILPQT